MEVEVIQTSTAKVWKGEHDIIFHEFLPDFEENLESAKENIDAIEQLCEGKKCLLLSDPTNLKSITREAREYYAKSEQTKRICKAVASISKSKSGRVMANFMMNFNKTAFPFKLFNTQEEALQWLLNIQE